MGNTDHTPVHQDNEQNVTETKKPVGPNGSTDTRQNANSGNPAQSAGSPNTPVPGKRPEPEGGQNGNPTTGKGSVEQDDEDVGGDQDIAPDPKIAPAVEGDADIDPGQAPKK